MNDFKGDRQDLEFLPQNVAASCGSWLIPQNIMTGSFCPHTQKHHITIKIEVCLRSNVNTMMVRADGVM